MKFIIKELAEKAGSPGLKPTFEQVRKNEIRPLVQGTLAALHQKKLLPKYDFIIVDEAHDLFARGLDLIIKSFLRDNNPLQSKSEINDADLLG